MGNKTFLIALLALILVGSIGVGAYMLGRRSVKPAPQLITTVRDTVAVDSIRTVTRVVTRTVTDTQFIGNPDLERLADSLLTLTDALLFDLNQIQDLRSEADTTIGDTRLLLGYSYRGRAFDIDLIREYADTTRLPMPECSSGWWKYAVGGAAGMLLTLILTTITGL